MSMAFHSAHFCVISKKKKKRSEIILTKRPSSSTEHKIDILLTANETPHLNPDLKHAQVTTG